jgi:hypothetical protein
MAAPIDKKSIDIEVDLLKSMSNRGAYNTYNDSIDVKKIFPSTKLLLEDYGKYFELYDHQVIDFKAFYTQFNTSWHNDMDTDDVEYYRDYVFPAIANSDAQQAEISLLGLIQKQTLEEINKSALKEFDIDKITAILDIFREKHSQIIQESDDDVYTIENIDFSTLDKSKGIPYFLPALQESLDSLVKGQFVVVTADTGGGKSAFSIAQAANTFKWLSETKSERPILYFNSEGTEADVYGRMLSNLFKEEFPGGFEQIFKEIDKVKEMLIAKYNPQNFKVFQLEGKTVGFIKAKMMKYNPSLVIVDIADTLVPEESPTTLKKLYDTLRQMSGTHCPILGTTQAGDMAYMNKETGKMETKKWLTTKDVYGAKQKAGAADTIIGIGVEPDSDIRYLNVAKLKRGIPVKLTLELQGIYSNFGEVKW